MEAKLSTRETRISFCWIDGERTGRKRAGKEGGAFNNQSKRKWKTGLQFALKHVGNFTVCSFYQKTYFLVLKILQKYVLVLALTLYVLDHDRLLPLLTKKRRVVKNKTQKRKIARRRLLRKLKAGWEMGGECTCMICVCVYVFTCACLPTWIVYECMFEEKSAHVQERTREMGLGGGSVKMKKKRV